jgi:mono/diheme cytochrome c family protein
LLKHIDGGALFGASIFVRMRSRGERMKYRKTSGAAIALALALFAGGVALGQDLLAVNPLSGDEKAIKSGKGWFRNTCTPCHGGRADGMGDMGTGADLRLLCDSEERPPGPRPGSVHAILFFPG